MNKRNILQAFTTLNQVICTWRSWKWFYNRCQENSKLNAFISGRVWTCKALYANCNRSTVRAKMTVKRHIKRGKSDSTVMLLARFGCSWLRERVSIMPLTKSIKYVTQGLKTHRLSLPRYWARGLNRWVGFSSLQFFNSAAVREFALSCKVVTRF